MVITKTKFMNLMRCPRYAALAMTKKDYQRSELSYEEYLKEEEDYKKKELTEVFHDLDLLEDEVSEQLEMMMPYYNEIEIIAAKYIKNLFGGKTKASKITALQESFDYADGNMRFLCYVDVYNESNNEINIIEVKATTSKKFYELGVNSQKNGLTSIFEKNNKGIYVLKNKLEEPLTEDIFHKKIAKLYDRYDKCGRYVYDLAIQRHIATEDYKRTNREHLLPKINYYLAILNHEYIYDGKDYTTDINGNEIISLFDMTQITADLQDKINLVKNRITTYLEELNSEVTPVGKWCEYKNQTKCEFIPFCYQGLPKNNNVFNYKGYHHGFKDGMGNKRSVYDLINEGIYSISDVPYNWLRDKKQMVERDCFDNYTEYFDHDKVRKGLNEIKYPIYHLDFETFPCPLPLNKGEKCYSQSVFQYSLHIEKSPGVCDFNNDHFEYLAKNEGDERRELIESLLNLIDTSKPGTVLVYNASFEKTRLKELAVIFPEYKDKIYQVLDMVFDLMHLIEGNKTLYLGLGFDESRASMFNYYHPGLSGSFSIKKVLPLFSDLTYDDLEVANGMMAMATYAKFPSLEEHLFDDAYKNLLAYCKQDTWAMVKVLDGLRQKNVSTSVQTIAL